MSARVSATKRFAKCWSRRALAMGSRFLGRGRNPGLTAGLRILTYHSIAEDPMNPFTVSPSHFASQMAFLATTGAVRALEEAVTGLESRLEGAESPRVVLTFDDGSADFLTRAAPILIRLRLPATLYVNPSCVGDAGFLGWEDLIQLSKAGFEIGSHGLEHHSLGKLSREEARRQVLDSRNIIEDRLGLPVTSLAYPYGTIRDFNEAVKSEVRCAGYRSACTSINGINLMGADFWALRRTKIEQGDDLIFPWILRGGLDAWAFVDRHLSLLQSHYA